MQKPDLRERQRVILLQHRIERRQQRLDRVVEQMAQAQRPQHDIRRRRNRGLRRVGRGRGGHCEIQTIDRRARESSAEFARALRLGKRLMQRFRQVYQYRAQQSRHRNGPRTIKRNLNFELHRDPERVDCAALYSILSPGSTAGKLVSELKIDFTTGHPLLDARQRSLPSLLVSPGNISCLTCLICTQLEGDGEILSEQGFL